MFKHLLNSTGTDLLLICKFMTSAGRAASVQEQIGRVIIISAPACCAFKAAAVQVGTGTQLRVDPALPSTSRFSFPIESSKHATHCCVSAQERVAPGTILGAYCHSVGWIWKRAMEVCGEICTHVPQRLICQCFLWLLIQRRRSGSLFWIFNVTYPSSFRS